MIPDEKIEELEAEIVRLNKLIKSLLPTSLIACPKCGVYGVEPGTKQCDKCRIAELEDIVEQQKNLIKQSIDIIEGWKKIVTEMK